MQTSQHCSRERKGGLTMNSSNRAWAKEILSHYGQEFEPTLIFEDEKLFVMDWRDKGGSGNLATRYIVDKEKGNLIITGDAGDCIASWYNEITPEKLVVYINSTGYFMEKMQCTTNKYTYKHEDIETDLEEQKQEYLGLLQNGDIDCVTEEELKEDFERIAEILEDYPPGENTVYSSEMTDILQKYDADWWEGPFSHLGRRIDKRIYLWTYGFQEGVERLRGKEFVRKDI